MIGVVLALVAAAGYGVSDFFGGIAARRVTALRVVVIAYPFSTLLVLALAPLVGGRPDPVAITWGVAAGLASGLAVWWFYAALADGPMAVVSPLTAVLVAGIPVLIGLILGERPTLAATAGIVLALLAVTLVSRESPPSEDERPSPIGGSGITDISSATPGASASLGGVAPDADAISVASTARADGAAPERPAAHRFTRRVALLTVGSGVAFGLTFYFLHETGTAAGLWPLVGQRAAATALIWVCAVPTGEFRGLRGVPLGLALAVGVLDVIANAAMLYAFHGSLLSLVSVIGSLYPAATVGLAMVLLGERINRSQQVGMLLALAAVGLIAVS